ncbi:unique cartilage matrix-associated protein [Electrophorus electricus]|uniref:unique cartilage matrix-associated protein n=1 Tax=Electrophorus electricus TaxID=8005 RepID=UPI000F0A85B4|nr:unique cartilage matrix-associated protein [Electrophorus electricus]
MFWMRPVLLNCLAVLFILKLFHKADSTTLSDGKKAAGPQGELKGIFMQERDATNFFRRRNRRAVKSQDEINAELRQRLAADERKREYHEERMNQFETYAEEEHDEQDERTQEKTEQWREFHYDGLDPSHEYNQGTI